MRKNYGMKARRSTEYNPQSNGVIERVHQVVGDMLRTYELEESTLDANDPFSAIMASIGFAIRNTFHTTLRASPSQLVFGRDTFLPIKFNADWAYIQRLRQTEMERNNKKENKSRIDHSYQVGDKVLLDKPGILRKMTIPRSGPHKVEAVYANGTIRIRKGIVSERVNIRRVHPFRERSRD